MSRPVQIGGQLPCRMHGSSAPEPVRFGYAASSILWGLVALAAAACAEVPAPQKITVLSASDDAPALATPDEPAAPKGSDVVLVETARGQVAWLQALLEEVKMRAARGELTATDVAQVESRLAAAKARQAGLEGALAESCARYRALVGQAAPGCPD